MHGARHGNTYGRHTMPGARNDPPTTDNTQTTMRP